MRIKSSGCLVDVVVAADEASSPPEAASAAVSVETGEVRPGGPACLPLRRFVYGILGFTSGLLATGDSLSGDYLQSLRGTAESRTGELPTKKQDKWSGVALCGAAP